MFLNMIGFLVCIIYLKINHPPWRKCLLGVRVREERLGSGEEDFGYGSWSW